MLKSSKRTIWRWTGNIGNYEDGFNSKGIGTYMGNEAIHN
jgi:hypothetical protein